MKEPTAEERADKAERVWRIIQRVTREGLQEHLRRKNDENRKKG